MILLYLQDRHAFVRLGCVQHISVGTPHVITIQEGEGYSPYVTTAPEGYSPYVTTAPEGYSP